MCSDPKGGGNQVKALDSITGNQAFAANGGVHGVGGSATAGKGGKPNGTFGTPTAGRNGATTSFREAIGGGLAVAADAAGATVDNTIITGNHADTHFNDVIGTITN